MKPTAPSSDTRERWVVVRRFIDTTEAELARARLEDLEVDARIEGDNDTLMFAGGSVQLLVRSGDAQRAHSTLEADALVEAPEDPLETAPRCTACDSIYMEERHSANQRLIGVFGFGLPLLFLKKRRLCSQCGTVQTDTERDTEHPYRKRTRRDGNPVFRLRQDRGVEGGLAGFGLGAVVNLITHGVPIGFIAGPIAGYLIGAGLGRFHCSNPKCRCPLANTDTHCPRCSGTIVGRISTPREHFIRKAAWHRGEDQADDT